MLLRMLAHFWENQEIKNSEANNDESKFTGIVWENKESSNFNINSQNKDSNKNLVIQYSNRHRPQR